MDKFIENIFENNRNWVKGKLSNEASYFENLAKGQQPPALWIGCADSRVPATEVTGTGPGDLFVHRNVANLVVPNDVNLLSVLEYAVHHLKVEHIIVCGHYGCGGVQAAMGNSDLGIINNWIRPIKDVYQDHRADLDNISDEKKRFDRLVELNTEAQVQSLSQTAIVQKAWKEKNRNLQIHAWVFDLASGHIKDLEKTINGPSSMDDIYRFA